jgi:hypothetical protein
MEGLAFLAGCGVGFGVALVMVHVVMRHVLRHR